jgi:hypothetical protein
MPYRSFILQLRRVDGGPLIGRLGGPVDSLFLIRSQQGREQQRQVRWVKVSLLVKNDSVSLALLLATYHLRMPPHTYIVCVLNYRWHDQSFNGEAWYRLAGRVFCFFSKGHLELQKEALPGIYWLAYPSIVFRIHRSEANSSDRIVTDAWYKL